MRKKKKLSGFNKRELKNYFYPMFLNLMVKKLETEAFLLMLATWNFACFRYAWKSFDLDKFNKTIKSLNPIFNKLRKFDFKTINLNLYEKEILKTFDTLARVKGVQKTGASKLMHLKAPKLFVMWDQYIRNHYGFKKGDKNDYFNFLKLMQDKFYNVTISSDRTLAKLIDEHNFKTITEPMLKKNKK